MHNAYEARDPGSTGWHDETGQRQGTPPPHAAGADSDFTLPQRPVPGRDGDTDASPHTTSLAYTMPQHSAPPDRDSGAHAGRDAAHAAPGPRARSDVGVDAARTAPPGQQLDGGPATPPAQQRDVERAVPAGQQIRDSIGRMVSTVRRSIPLRTLLFLLPPLALPTLAFDLSLTATLLVALTLLWLAAAAGVFCMMMLEGSQHLALRSIERRLDSVTAGGVSDDDALQEALLAIGAQLDTLGDRVAALGQNDGVPVAEEQLEVLSHRPQEHWPNSPGDEQYDRYGQPAVPDTNWSESRWRR